MFRKTNEKLFRHEKNILPLADHGALGQPAYLFFFAPVS